MNRPQTREELENDIANQILVRQREITRLSNEVKALERWWEEIKSEPTIWEHIQREKEERARTKKEMVKWKHFSRKDKEWILKTYDMRIERLRAIANGTYDPKLDAHSARDKLWKAAKMIHYREEDK